MKTVSGIRSIQSSFLGHIGRSELNRASLVTSVLKAQEQPVKEAIKGSWKIVIKIKLNFDCFMFKKPYISGFCFIVDNIYLYIY